MTPVRAAWQYLLLAFGGALFVAMTLAWGLASIPLALVLPARAGRFVGRRVAFASFRAYLGLMEMLGAWRLDLGELDALRDAGPLIVAPNHPCLLDAVLLISRLPDGLCVMKGSLAGNLLLGPAARLAHYVNNDALLKLIRRAGEELEAGGQLVLFPEGTRTQGGAVGPLTEALGALSRRTGVPVQAVIIEADSPFLGKGWRLLARPDLPLTYRVRVGRRFDPPRDVRAFTQELARYYARELAARPAHAMPGHSPDAGIVEDAPHFRG